MRTTRWNFHAFFLAATLTLALVPSRAAFADPPEAVVGFGGTYLAEGSDLWGTGMRSAGLVVQGSLPLTHRFSIEAIGTAADRTTDSGSTRTERSFGFNVKQRLLASEQGGFHAFLTYGAAGVYYRERWPDRTYTLANGRSYTAPAYTYEGGPSIPFPTIGGGVQQELGAHAAIRADIQTTMFLFLPVGVRASLGLVVPIGHYDR